jgi:histidyl-tRNA synthetase
MVLREHIFATVTRCFRRHGAVTIQTPVKEKKKKKKKKKNQKNQKINNSSFFSLFFFFLDC